MYFIRDAAGETSLAITFRGALEQMALVDKEVAVYSVFTGRWIAGRGWVNGLCVGA